MYFSIVAIDPGNNLGVAIFTINSVDMSIVNIECKLYVLSDNVDMSNPSRRMVNKLLYIGKICEHINNTYKPLILFTESAFINKRFPMAIMNLAPIMSMVQVGFLQVNPNIKIVEYPPKYVKKYIGAGGGADKDDMSKYIDINPEIKQHIDSKLISEHEVDAIAIAYVGLCEIRKYPHILYLN